MSKSQQCHARAAKYGELIKHSIGLAEIQIGRFESGRGKLPLTEDARSDAKSVALALSRWDNEGGAVANELPMKIDAD